MKAEIPDYYLYVLGVVGLLSVISILSFFSLVKTKIYVSRALIFFFLGAAFSLIETKSIVQLNLLFGVTWVVNAIAFVGILVSVLLAVLLMLKVKVKKLWIFGILILASLAIQYFTPIDNLLYKDIGTKLLIAIPYFYLPIFFSNLLFASIFKESERSEIDFGTNLLGLVLGGFTEYVALITGYSFLAVVAGLFYLIAFLLSFKLSKNTS